MMMETSYCVTAENEENIQKIASFWDEIGGEIDCCSFEDFDTDVFGVMEKVIKAIHKMDAAGSKLNFQLAGKCESDYDCIVFSIEYTGDEPLIKASQADPEENEGRFYYFMDAEYDDIPKILNRNKNRTFQKAIKDDLPLGGFLDTSYEEWVASILAE